MRAGFGVAAGSAKDRRGNPMTIKLVGPVEPYFRKDEPPSGGRESEPPAV